jgi:hypothetical protein
MQKSILKWPAVVTKLVEQLTNYPMFKGSNAAGTAIGKDCTKGF